MEKISRIRNGTPIFSSSTIANACRLLAVNVVSLVFALVSNASLLLNMTRRLSFSIAQPITIIGWFLASFLLIGIIAPTRTKALHYPGVKDQALSQAYYYAIMAAGVYFIISFLMVINVYGAYKGHYGKDFKLTMSQRTLMLQTISFLTYMLAGAAVYAHIEGWKYLDAVYWADFTLLTIGIGDYSPSTHLGRGLLFPYAIGGIVILGLVVGSIRSLVLERGKKKMSARMTEKRREQVLKKAAQDNSDSGLQLDPIKKDPSHAELRRRKTEFHTMRRVQQMAAVERKWISLLISGSAWFILWFAGAAIFWVAERNQKWTYFQSLYFAYTSLLTIGYGDFAPYSNSGKPFFVFWSLLAIPTLTILISNMGDTVVKMVKDLTLWVGEVTVLPGDAPMRDKLRYGIHKATAGKLAAKDIEDIPPPGHSKTDQDEKQKTSGPDRIAAQLEVRELEEEEHARQKGDTISKDIHHYHYILIREIRKVWKHTSASPEKKYSFEEWAWFLKLIGEDESSAKFHRAAPIKVKKNDGEEPDLGKGQEANEDEEVKPWSWLGHRSPLMGEKSEAEWVLGRLYEKLEKELKDQRKTSRRNTRSGRLPSRGSSRTLDGGSGS
jgi:potassium channel subfamily K, other eukaryote